MGCAKPHATHWQDLRSRPPAVIAELPGVAVTAQGVVELGFLTERYRVDLAAERIDPLGSSGLLPLSDAFQILLLTYLLAPHGGPLLGEPISVKELPGGATFFRGPHALPVGELVERYGTDPAGFEARARELGGEPMPHGDRAMRLWPFPSVPVTYVLWEADSELPAAMSAMFDRSVARWFGLDTIFIMAGEIARRLVS